MANERIIKAGNGIAGLKPAGHARREQLKARTDNLAEMADRAVNATDAQIYSVDEEKLKEEPEILRHLDMSTFMFKVNNPVPGKVYFWERDTATDHSAVARKQAEARMWLGNSAKGWQVVCGAPETHPEFPEAPELVQVDGVRRIGDVILMRIDLDEYTRIQKRILLATRFKESNIAMQLGEFVRQNEGMVSVIEGKEDPRVLYAREHQGRQLVHTSRAPSAEAE